MKWSVEYGNSFLKLYRRDHCNSKALDGSASNVSFRGLRTYQPKIFRQQGADILAKLQNRPVLQLQKEFCNNICQKQSFAIT